jgi:hypothetical protein
MNFLILIIFSSFSGLLTFYYARNGERLSVSKPVKKIFFLETSFRSDLQGFTMNLRQACSIESAAKMNPERAVEVLFATKLAPENREFHLNFKSVF